MFLFKFKYIFFIISNEYKNSITIPSYMIMKANRFEITGSSINRSIESIIFARCIENQNNEYSTQILPSILPREYELSQPHPQKIFLELLYLVYQFELKQNTHHLHRDPL